MFNLAYHNETGLIVVYNEGDADSLDVPAECTQLSFKDHIPGFYSANHSVAMKVDVKTGKLVLLNPVEIPEPIANVPNAAK